MKDFGMLLLLAAMPAFGNFLGGITAEFFQISRRTLSLALHAAAGILFAVISVELIPRALEQISAFIVAGSFFAGGVLFLFVDQSMNYVSARFRGIPRFAKIWPIYFGVFIDLFADGVMIGAGTTVSFSLGLLLALGQVTADLPEGFATTATLKNYQITRTKRIWIILSFAIPAFLGATIGYFVVQGQGPALQFGLLSFVAGLLLTVMVEEIIPEAHDEKDSRWAAICLVGGFALFVLVSALFGGE